MSGLHANTSWTHLLEQVLLTGAEVAPRGKRTKELIASQTVTKMDYPIVSIRQRKLGYRFMAAEAYWIMSGDNRVSTIAPYSSVISKFSDDGEYFNGAYGPPFVDQLSYVLHALRTDESTRQAVFTIWRPRPAPSKDIPCTVSAQWLLRRFIEPEIGGLLHCVMTMRSSDIWLGWPYDVFNFSMMSAFILLHLRKADWDKYSRFHLGNLYMTSGSQHLYEEHWKPAREIVQSEGKFRTVYDRFMLSDFGKDPQSLLSHLKACADRDYNSLNGGGFYKEFLTAPLQKENLSNRGY